MNGIQPVFNRNSIKATKQRTLKSNRTVHKRILKRIHKSRRGSESSHSSIESEYLTVRSDRPESVRPQESNRTEQKDENIVISNNENGQERRKELTQNLLNGKDDAHT